MNIITQIFNWFTQLISWWIMVLPWEQGLRIWMGKSITVLGPGLHFKLPLLHAAYKQVTRLRVMVLPMQTLTTKDGVAICLVATLGYEVTDLKKLYTTLHQPEATLHNLVQGFVAEYIAERKMEDCNPGKIQQAVHESLQLEKYGLGCSSFKITGFVSRIRTIRLLQDQHWMSDALRLDSITNS